MDARLDAITFRNMQVFFTVVEEGSFTGAADRLHMTQSAVSKNIAHMEQELDLLLFTRRHKEIILTEAGADLYQKWKDSATGMSSAYKHIWGMQHQEDKTLRIGVVLNLEMDFFWPLIDRLQARFPEVSIEYDSNRILCLIRQLQEGNLDLILLPDFMSRRLEQEGLEWTWAAQGDAIVIMPADHPLADQELTLDLLRNEKWITLEDDIPDNVNYMRELFAERGYEVHLGKRFSKPENIALFYQKEDGISLTDAFFNFNNTREKLVMKPLKDVQTGIICVWNPTAANIYVKRFIEEVKKQNLNAKKCETDSEKKDVQKIKSQTAGIA